MSAYVFAYGTLRRGFSNHHLLSRALTLGGARTVRPYSLYLDDFPYCVQDEPAGPVTGEVYKVDDATLLVLDALEEHPHVYRRELVPVTLDDGRQLDAWLYFYPTARGRRVPSGNLADIDRKGA